jgi:glycosyltransferase involved in cell wall biosynthesis
MTLIGVDVPRPLAFYKRGSRGVILYYYLWQIVVGLTVRRLQRSHRYDVLHQLNFHTDWAPHFLRSRDAKVVWGPIGHVRPTPRGYFPGRWTKSLASDRLRTLTKWCFWHLDPFLRLAIGRTDVILYANNDLAPPFKRHRAKVVLRPYAGSFMETDPPVAAASRTKFVVLAVGRLIPLKGFVPVIDAFTRFFRESGEPDDVELHVVGSGELLSTLKRRVRSGPPSLASHVRFTSWTAQAELRDAYEHASVFLMPSMEPQGLVIAEAMSAGLAVIAVEGTGPAFLAGSAALHVARNDDKVLTDDLVAGLHVAYGSHSTDNVLLADVRRRSVSRYVDHLSWKRIVADILECYS